MARKSPAKPAASVVNETTVALAAAQQRAGIMVAAFDDWMGRGPGFAVADVAWLIEHPDALAADFWAAHVAAHAGAGQRAYPYEMLSLIDKARIAIFMAAVLAG